MAAVTALNPVFPHVELTKDSVGNFAILPLEMILHIVTLLEKTYGDFKTISRLSTTSRTFHVITGYYASQLIKKIFPNHPATSSPLELLQHFHFEKTNGITYAVLHKEAPHNNLGRFMPLLSQGYKYLYCFYEFEDGHEEIKTVSMEALSSVTTTIIPHREGCYTTWKAICHESKLLAIGSSSGSIHLFDCSNPSTVVYTNSLKGHRAPVFDLVFSPCGNLLCCATGDFQGNNGTITLWNIETKVKYTLIKNMPHINNLAFSKDGMRLFASFSGGAIKVWNYVEETELFTLSATLTEAVGNIHFIAVLRDNKRLISLGIGEDYTVQLWDIVADIPTLTITIREESAITNLDYSYDCKTLYLALSDGTIHVWDISSDTAIKKATLGGHSAAVSVIQQSLDHKTLISGSHDNTIRVWNMVACKESGVLPINRMGTDGRIDPYFLFSRSENSFVASLHDGTIRLYHLD